MVTEEGHGVRTTQMKEEGLTGQTKQREHHTTGKWKVETEKEITMKKEDTKLILALEEGQKVAHTQVLMVMKVEEFPQAASGVTDPQAVKDLMMID